MANLENSKNNQSKGKGKKDMASAVNSTEKIRTWNEHMIEIEQLAAQLETKIKNKETDKNYFGLTEAQA